MEALTNDPGAMPIRQVPEPIDTKTVTPVDADNSTKDYTSNQENLEPHLGRNIDIKA